MCTISTPPVIWQDLGLVNSMDEPLDEEDDCEEEDPRDSIAETLIRWVPPLTAIICAGFALWGFVYYQFMM